MNSEPSTPRCPKCGGPIPADAPQGLCPHCVLSGAATSNESGPGERPEPPPLAAIVAAFPNLEILELIGVGGMGVVYKARQIQLDRVVALKLLPVASGADPAFTERFHREAKFLARLRHPNIVGVHEYGEAGGFCFLLLEYVDGVNLRQAMEAGRFSAAEALAIVPDICRALQYAHEQGVLHRDIKPENILLDARGAVKLADFGIAKLARDPGGRRSDITLTRQGSRLGTPHYMAPEQIETPSDVDHRADIYSLGVVFYELLTGELPLGRFAAPSEKASLDARVDAIVFRALAKERELRQQSAAEVRSDIEGLGGSPAGNAPRAAGDARKAAVPRAPGGPGVNPWPHRLFWLMLAIVALPFAAILASVAALRMFGSSLGGLVTALVSAAVGAGMAAGWWRTRPRESNEASRGPWNPWPKRIFWAMTGLVVLPMALLLLGLAIPRMLMSRAPLPTPPSITESMPGFTTPKLGAGALRGRSTEMIEEAIAKYQGAMVNLENTIRLADLGKIAANGPEMLAAQRDAAVARAELDGRHGDALHAQVVYTTEMFRIANAKEEVGAATRAEVDEATRALESAERALRAWRDPNVLSPKVP